MQLPIENVQDYPRPPAIEPVPQRIRVDLAGQTIADTTSAWRVLETHHAPTYYVPRADVSAVLHPAAGSSYCEWKGAAQYWTVEVDGKPHTKIAWSYPNPTERFAALADHLAFYVNLVDAAWVGDVQATAQPGDFYGGWVTPNLDGIVKGGPGTRHW